MALFFDQDWFQQRLAKAGLSHDALASAAGLTLEDLAAVWKDQMEVTGEMVAGFASALGVDAREIASRCGVSTPDAPDHDVGHDAGHDADFAARPDLSENEDIRAMAAEGLARLGRLEEDMAVLQTLVNQLVADRTSAKK